MHDAPSQFLLDHIPSNNQDKKTSMTSSAPLLELLQNAAPGTDTVDSTPPAASISVPGIQSHIELGDDSSGNTRPNFAGAAQNANADSYISTPWILDREGWSLTSVSNAFKYIVSTTHEDQKVAKTLAGWSHNDEPHLPTLQAFDSLVLLKFQQLQASLFACQVKCQSSTTFMMMS
ncbi:hypothetical protein PHMEG_00031915 [Phytophthora megakarya]|uniref:Uncharacterized protein n=1 Tax=Phytophthora megakarya TaxID=4795 RepID=A0A225UWX9_9STRA|nr:hypothetical protein PHMEG_00031915 [Phytophthora megakarya]